MPNSPAADRSFPERLRSTEECPMLRRRHEALVHPLAQIPAEPFARQFSAQSFLLALFVNQCAGSDPPKQAPPILALPLTVILENVVVVQKIFLICRKRMTSPLLGSIRRFEQIAGQVFSHIPFFCCLHQSRSYSHKLHA